MQTGDVAVHSVFGHAAILGVAPGAEVRTDAIALLEGRSVTGSIVGHQAPAVALPRILALHAQGRFPLDAMIRTFPLAEIATAVADMRSEDGREGGAAPLIPARPRHPSIPHSPR